MGDSNCENEFDKIFGGNGGEENEVLHQTYRKRYKDVLKSGLEGIDLEVKHLSEVSLEPSQGCKGVVGKCFSPSTKQQIQSRKRRISKSSLLLKFVLGEFVLDEGTVKRRRRSVPLDEVFDGLHMVDHELPRKSVLMIRRLLREGADPQHIDADGHFCLPIVLHYPNGFEELFGPLLEAGADVHMQWQEMSLLDVALSTRQVKCVERLLKMQVLPLTMPSDVEDSLVGFALVYGMQRLCLRVLARGFWIALESDCVRGMECMIAHGVPVDLRHPKRKTSALYWAVQENSRDMIAMLLDRGADPNAVDATRTPMMAYPVLRRSKEDSFEIVKLLLNYNADTSMIVSDSKETLCQFAVNNAICSQVISLFNTDLL